MEDEGIDPDQFAGAVDANSLFMHFFPDGNEATEKSTGELKAAKAAGITDHACCAFITSMRQKYPPYMMEEGNCPVTVGAPFPMLSNHTAWEGKPALEGGKKSLLKDVKDARDTAFQYIQDNYPAGEFHKLCHTLITRSYDWWVALSAYISDELLNWDSTAFQNVKCTL
eukprot:scaffold33085_cov82-Cyclotella_meneghiniana.AAC.1